jgi:hypothetical protein
MNLESDAVLAQSSKHLHFISHLLSSPESSAREGSEALRLPYSTANELHAVQSSHNVFSPLISILHHPRNSTKGRLAKKEGTLAWMVLCGSPVAACPSALL